MSVVNFIDKNFTPEEKHAINSDLTQNDAQLLHDEHTGKISRQELANKINPQLLKVLSSKQTQLNVAKRSPTVLQQFGQNHPVLGHVAGELGNAGQLVSGSIHDALTKMGINDAPDKTNYYNAYGVEPNTIDQFAAPAFAMAATAPLGELGAGRALESAGSQLAPEVLSNAKNISGLAAGGALSSPGDEGNGALASADAGGLIKGGVDAAAPAISEGLKRFAGQFGQNEMARNVMGSLKNRLGDTGNSIADFLKSGYDEAMGKFHNNIDTSRDLAKNIPIENFDSSPYKKALTDYLDESKSLTPIEQESRQDAMDFAHDQLKKNIIPTNLNDLLLKNKTLNQDADKFYKGKYQMADGADHETNQLVQRLKNGIQGTFDKNIENAKNGVNSQSPISDSIQKLKDSFNMANQNYSFAHNLAKLPDANGNLSPDKSLLAFFKSGKPVDGKVVDSLNNTYLKSGSNDLNHLSTMIGDENSKKSLAAAIYNKAAGDKGIDMVSLVNNYRKLKPEIRDHVFNPDEKSMLDALSETKANSRTVSHVPYSRSSPLTYMLPAIAGVGGYGAHGAAGAVGSALAAMLAEKGAGKMLGKPNVVRQLFSNQQLPIVNKVANGASKVGGFTGAQANKYVLPMFEGDKDE